MISQAGCFVNRKSHIFENSREVTRISIKEMRKKKGISQAELAKALNIDQTAVTQWEVGRTAPRFHRLKAIAEILGCTIDDLLKDDEAADES